MHGDSQNHNSWNGGSISQVCQPQRTMPSFHSFISILTVHLHWRILSPDNAASSLEHGIANSSRKVVPEREKETRKNLRVTRYLSQCAWADSSDFRLILLYSVGHCALEKNGMESHGSSKVSFSRLLAFVEWFRFEALHDEPQDLLISPLMPSLRSAVCAWLRQVARKGPRLSQSTNSRAMQRGNFS